MNFLTNTLDGRSTLRPTDILVFGLVGGKHTCVDLTGVSPLVGLSSQSFTLGHAALKAISYKVVKHEKACIENQHVMHSNAMTPRSTNVVFKRISFAIQKRLAAQLVARLPSNSM